MKTDHFWLKNLVFAVLQALGRVKAPDKFLYITQKLLAFTMGPTKAISDAKCH